jgi:hypothetical protein
METAVDNFTQIININTTHGTFLRESTPWLQGEKESKETQQNSSEDEACRFLSISQ